MRWTLPILVAVIAELGGLALLLGLGRSLHEGQAPDAALAQVTVTPTAAPTQPPYPTVPFSPSPKPYVGNFTVNSTADTLDAAPGDGVCADAAGACTLRAAVMETNALPGPDTVAVPAGTYVLAIPSSPPKWVPEVGTIGALHIIDDLTLTGAGTAATVIDGDRRDGVLKVGYIYQGSRPKVDIRSLTIQHGLANLSGGGILNGGILTIRDLVIRDNQAGQMDGGGISNGGQLTVIDSAIISNGAQTGGGISNYGSMALINTTIAENTGVDQGGGVYSFGTASLINVTVQGNQSKEAGGIGGGTNITIKNTIVSGNGIIGNCVSPLASSGHNIVSDNSCTLTGPGDLNGVDPMLGPLADNGGPTQTHALLAGSPAINAGDNNGCPASDQRGVARPPEGTCDIGAYEYVPPATPAPTAKPAIVTASPTPSPTAAPTDSPTPAAKPSPSRTPKRSRTASPTALPSSDDGGGGAGLIIGLTLGGFALAAAGGGGGYYIWRRRRIGPAP